MCRSLLSLILLTILQLGQLQFAMMISITRAPKNIINRQRGKIINTCFIRKPTGLFWEASAYQKVRRKVWTDSPFAKPTSHHLLEISKSAKKAREGLRRQAHPEAAGHDAAAESTDTIFALSSGQGRAGVAVIRISGPLARYALEHLIIESSHSSFPSPRTASLRKLFCPLTKEILDQALVLWFPAPRSFTGEDTVELQVHGSRAVIKGVTDALLALNKKRSQGHQGGLIRPADRGEFTERAFSNGRMDLTEVEGLADLIAADTSAQRKQALRQMGGSLREVYEAWREELKVCLAHTEAVIDFGDDELDVDDSAYEALRPRVENLRREMQTHLADGNRGEVIRSGIRVAIVGPPNAGKSSLLNLLARRPAAIVSPIAGTTRDVVEVQLELAGLPVVVSDTAGIREVTSDPVEIEGIRRAKQVAGQAQLTVVVLDASAALGMAELKSLIGGVGVESFLLSPDNSTPDGLPQIIEAIEEQPSLLLVINKRDIVQNEDGKDIIKSMGKKKNKTRRNTFFVSCATGEGVDEMLTGLQARLEGVFDANGGEGGSTEVPVITRARHRLHVERCVMALTAFLEDQTLGQDTAAEELRIASIELGKITGAVDVEEVLDVIFRDFCIGK